MAARGSAHHGGPVRLRAPRQPPRMPHPLPVSHSVEVSVSQHSRLRADRRLATTYFKFSEVQRASRVAELAVALKRGQFRKDKQRRAVQSALQAAKEQHAADGFRTTAVMWVNLYGAAENQSIAAPVRGLHSCLRPPARYSR